MSVVTHLMGIHEDARSTPGLSQRVRYMALLRASSCSSDLTPRLGTSICRTCGPKKKKKKKDARNNDSEAEDDCRTEETCNLFAQDVRLKKNLNRSHRKEMHDILGRELGIISFLVRNNAN